MAWRRQAIIWANTEPILKRTYAALGGNELTCPWTSSVSFFELDNLCTGRLCIEPDQFIGEYEWLQYCRIILGWVYETLSPLWGCIIDPSLTMHYFVTEKCAHMCTFLWQNGTLWDMWLVHCGICAIHYTDVIMTTIASQITSLTVVYSTVYSDADQRKHQTPRHWPLCGEFTGTGEFPAQMASKAENVSIWWRHHGSIPRCDIRHTSLTHLPWTTWPPFRRRYFQMNFLEWIFLFWLKFHLRLFLMV